MLEDCTRFDLRGLSHTLPTFRGPDLGHLTDLCPRGLVGFAVNAEDDYCTVVLLYTLYSMFFRSLYGTGTGTGMIHVFHAAPKVPLPSTSKPFVDP